MPPLSPLAPAQFPALKPIAGVRLGATNCGIRYKGRTDLLLVELANGTTAAGVFTRSLTASAPVEWCRRNIREGRARALVVNSGNANAFTGKAGHAAVKLTAQTAAELCSCWEREVFLASTGVIGEPLPVERIVEALPRLHNQIGAESWEDAARGMMTTDTFAKGASATAQIDEVEVRINGIAKGSGMIAPNMGTMLAYVFTDAALPAPVLQTLLEEANERSFNSITVDGDTSTSDTAMLFATGRTATKIALTDTDDPRLDAFRAALDTVLIDLAQQIVRDGEGASRFVTIAVRGAENDEAARRVGLAIGNSPLVKTAIAGGDPNWGRIVMAVGKSGERVAPEKLIVRLGPALVARGGAVDPDYREAPTAAYMRGREIEIGVDLGVGAGRATVWTCDLTHAYIDINADYRS